jgi:hypothetical protein
MSQETVNVCRVVPYYRTGRRYFEYQKNTQTEHITFTPEYYSQIHEPQLSLQHKYFKALSEQPQIHPSVSVPELDEEVRFPDSDERYQKMLSEKKRTDEVSFTQHRSRYYEAIRLQVQEKEQDRESQHRAKKMENKERQVHLHQLEEQAQQQRVQRLLQSQQYCQTLGLQSQLKVEKRQQLLLEESQHLAASPSVKSSKTNTRLVEELRRFPEFQEPQYTSKRPKLIHTDPISFDRSVRSPEDVKRTKAHNMSEYGSMMLRQQEIPGILIEPIYGKGSGLGYTDTRRLLI